MPNYEELYYSARRKYYQAIDTRNSIQRRTSELQGRRSGLISELSRRNDVLRKAQRKLSLLQDAEEKCRSVLSGEFETMKKYIQGTAEEYKKIISTDKGVADIQQVYNDDVNKTRSSLNNLLQELIRKRQEAEQELTNARQSVDRCSGELNDVTRQLNSVGSASYAQSQADNYYAQMKQYQRKWENGG